VGQLEPTVGDVRTITWEKGREDRPVTWELGKLGVLAHESTVRPGVGEVWAVKVLKDTNPGARGGVLILMPLHPASADAPVQQDAVVDELAIENVTNVIQLAVTTISPDAEVKIERGDRTVRYWINPPANQATAFLGQAGALIAALRTVAANMLTGAGVQAWIEVVTERDAIFATCQKCGEQYRDPLDFSTRTTTGGAEERFENGRPARYTYRICGCGTNVYSKKPTSPWSDEVLAEKLGRV
jgi:hypothetical protein